MSDFLLFIAGVMTGIVMTGIGFVLGYVVGKKE